MLPIVGLLATTGATAFAQSDEPSGMSQFLGYLGLIELPKDPIEYRERAPLVVPPSVALVPPQQQTINQINPDFPVDHDARRAKANRIDSAEQARQDDIFYNNRKLSAEEMTRKRPRDRNAGPGPATDENFHNLDKSRMTPSQLGFKGWNNKAEENTVVFAGEPERGSLIDPPPGYRTPSPNAPYGVVTQTKKAARASNVMEKTADSDPYGRR